MIPMPTVTLYDLLQTVLKLTPVEHTIFYWWLETIFVKWCDQLDLVIILARSDLDRAKVISWESG
jgi:hypothetical protein